MAYFGGSKPLVSECKVLKSRDKVTCGFIESIPKEYLEVSGVSEIKKKSLSSGR